MPFRSHDYTKTIIIDFMLLSIQQSIQAREKNSQMVWTGLILMFFLIQAVIWTVAFCLTASDQSHSVVSGYDEKALKWDEEKALRIASEKLGWQAKLKIDSTGDIHNMHLMNIELNDPDDLPIEEATIRLLAFHRSRSSVKQTIELMETSAGIYSGKIKVDKSGLWQFEGSAIKDDKTFLINQRQHLKVSQ